MTENALIIGAGPAGLSAAIQLARQDISPIVFENRLPGGLLWNACFIENYPGFPDGISGPDLAALFVRQAERMNIPIRREPVIALDWQNDRFVAATPAQTFDSRFAVIASGTKPITLQVDAPRHLAHRLIHDAHSILNLDQKIILIIGAGDAAFDYALNLSRKNEVVILSRSHHPRCLPLLFNRAQENARIRYIPNTVISKIDCSPQNEAFAICSNPDGDITIAFDYVLIAIGRAPESSFMRRIDWQKINELKNKGHLFFAGDIGNGAMRQTAIATGDGIRSAMQIAMNYRKIR